MDLYLFTSSYPYGNGEGFLEDEVPFLAEKFDNVYVVPFWVTDLDSKRSMPYNFHLLNPAIIGRTRNNLIGLLGGKAFGLYAKDFFRSKVYLSKVRLKSWFGSYYRTNCIMHNKEIMGIASRLKPHDVCYFYWGVGLNVLAVQWKGKAKFVSRFHATVDLWEDARDGYTPLRKELSKSLDLAVFISNMGMEYFHKHYADSKVLLSRLGAFDFGTSEKSKDGIVRIVSCSNVIPLKRVPMIMEALSQVKDYRIEWTHIGSGTEMGKLEEMAKEKESDVFRVNLLGQVRHDQVIEYFKTHPVDLFINLSTSEGVPVSIMEAISFDVPCIATDVGATREIVTEETGVLLDSNPTFDEVVDAVGRIMTRSYHPKAFWNKYYNAQSNYEKFVNALLNLSKE